MKNRTKFKAVILFVAITLALGGCGNDNKFIHEIKLEDNGSLLTNPHMGWNFCYYSNQINSYGSLLKEGDYLDEFPCNVVYFRLGWNFIQPDETFYEVVLKPMGYEMPDGYAFDGSDYWWELIDDIADEWTSRGKKLAFRITANDAWGQCTPLWVKDKGANGIEYDPITTSARLSGNIDKYVEEACREDGISKEDLTAEQLREYEEKATPKARIKTYRGFCEEAITWYGTEEEASTLTGRKTWCPDFGDETFLSSYKTMMTALRNRYSKYIEFVEIGGIGTWGEGHAGQAEVTRQFITEEAKAKHLDLLYEVFGTKYKVLVNDDVVKGTNLFDKCKQYGFGCTDDSFLVAQRETGTDNYTGDYLDTFFYNGLYTAIEPAPEQTPRSDVLMEAIWKNHASYMRLIIDPAVMAENEYADDITRQVGYRINFTGARFSELRAGSEFKIELALRNVGAAPCYNGGYPNVKIFDEYMSVVAEATSDFNVADLEVANNYEEALSAESVKVTLTLNVPSDLEAGRYFVCIGVVDETGWEILNLPLNDGYNKQYRIATFDLQ